MTTDALALRRAPGPSQSRCARLAGQRRCRCSSSFWRSWRSGMSRPVAMNWQGVADAFERAGEQRSTSEILAATLEQERPVLPAPHQILVELKKTVIDTPVTSRRSLVFHAWVTLSSTLLGFALGTLLGIVLAVLIVHVRTLERSLMPWIISSQTIPILAIAPIIIVVLGSIGITGLLPKAIISAYLCFFPVTIGMVKGLTSPDLHAARSDAHLFGLVGADLLEAAPAGLVAVICSPA